MSQKEIIVQMKPDKSSNLLSCICQEKDPIV